MNRYWAAILGVGLVTAFAFLVGGAVEMLPWFGTFVPRLDIDFALLFSQVYQAREFWHNTGTVWGYDPFFLGGYIDPFLWNSNVNLQIFSLLMPSLSAAATIKLYVVMLWFALPLVFWAIGRRWARTSWAASYPALFTYLVICLFGASLMGELFRTAMTSTVLVMPLSLLAMLILADLLADGRPRDGVQLALCTALALLAHKKALWMVGVPALVLLVAYRRRLTWSKLTWAGGAAAFSLAANWFWFYPMLTHLDLTDFSPAMAHWYNPDPWALVRDLIDPHAKVGIFHRSTGWASLVWRWLLFLGLAFGYVIRRAKRDQPRAGAFLAIWVLAMAFSYFGSLIPGANALDPSGSILYAELLALPFAADALYSRFGKREPGRTIAFAVLALLLALPALLPPHRPWDRGSARDAQREAADWSRLARRIAETPRTGGRVLFESYHLFHRDRDPFRNLSGFGHLVLPAWTGALYCGAQYPHFFVVYNRANFSAGLLARRPIEDWNNQELAAFLEAYHVDLVVAHSAPALAVFGRRFAAAREVWREGPHVAFRYEPTGSFFARGSGEVRFEYGRILLSGLQPEQGQVVVRSHYIEGLRADDGSPVQPVDVPGAIFPFIGVQPRGERVILSF